MVDTLPIVALALALATLPLIGALVLRRVRIAYVERRQDRFEQQVSPLALLLVDGEEVEDTELGALEAEALAQVLGRYAQVLNGESRARIAEFFEASGATDAELERLHSRRAWRRATAAKTLGDMGAVGAMAGLIEALDDGDLAVRSTAARSLGKLQRSDAVEPLVRALASGSVPRAAAGLALLEIGTAAVPALEKLLDADDEYVRATAVELIGKLGCASEGERMLECLDDPSAEVRARACRALGRLGSAEASRKLRLTLDARVPFLRAAAAVGLGRMGDPDAIDDLIAQARVDGYTPARAAARAVTQIAPARVTEAAESEGAGQYLREEADRIAWGLA